MRHAAAALALALASASAITADPDVAARPPVEDLAPRGPSVDARLARIALSVQQALVYPELARRERIQGDARLSFEIDAAGHPRDVELAESSGSQSLDRAAQQALLDAGPLPYVAGRISVPVHFGLACQE